MPETSSPFDDPFADLFGKLPDPRTMSMRAAATEPPTSGATGASAQEGDSAPPLSRRAAREASERASAAADTPPETAAPIQAAAPVPSPSTTAEAGAPAPAQAATPTPEARVAAQTTKPSAASGSLEDLFTGSHTTDDLGAPPPPPNKRRRRKGGWIALGIVLVLLGGAAAGGLWVWNTYEDKIREVMGWEEPKDYEDGLANGEVVVTIVSGDTGGPISQTLYDAGVTKTPDAFYDYLIANSLNPPFVPGAFRLQKQMTSEAALNALLDPANKLENTAQLREGLTVEQSLPKLAEGTGLALEDFQAAVADPAAYGVAADSLEGWLFPATYTFDPGVTANDVIQTLVDRTVSSLDAAGVPVDQRQEILTIASIIQREARFEDDFYKVSRVIQNRMDPSNQETFGLLQMDSTAQYGFGEMHEGSASTSAEAQYDPNPWNTYVHAGLPVGPISNPGDVAIDAAMHPADGPWLYFVTVNLDTGETVFTSTYAEHQKYVKQMQTWCADHPDSGC